jgi:hypothetical protein
MGDANLRAPIWRDNEQNSAISHPHALHGAGKAMAKAAGDFVKNEVEKTKLCRAKAGLPSTKK